MENNSISILLQLSRINLEELKSSLSLVPACSGAPGRPWSRWPSPGPLWVELPPNRSASQVPWPSLYRPRGLTRDIPWLWAILLTHTRPPGPAFSWWSRTSVPRLGFKRGLYTNWWWLLKSIHVVKCHKTKQERKKERKRKGGRKTDRKEQEKVKYKYTFVLSLQFPGNFKLLQNNKIKNVVNKM